MILGTKMLYVIQDERDISMAYNNDCAYYIVGKEIRFPTQEGMKIFVLSGGAPNTPTNNKEEILSIKKRARQPVKDDD